MSDLQKTRELIKNKPYLNWSTSNYNDLSEESVVEAILNNGDWSDYLELENILGIDEVKQSFDKICARKRSNLRPSTYNYFSKYLAKYA